MRLNPFLCTLFFIAFSWQSAAAQDPIKIGAVFSLSGWGADGGSSELNGALLAQDDINSAGGVLGRPIKLIVEDNNSDLKNTASAVRKLIDVDKVSAFVGPNWTEFAEIAAPIAEAAKIPFISPTGFKEDVFTGKHFAFTLWPPEKIATEPLAEILKQRGFRSVAVLLTENSYLNGIFESVKTQLSNSPVEIKSVTHFNQGQSDFRSTISKLNEVKPDAVLVLLVENGDLSNFFVQARQLHFPSPLFTANGIPFDEVIKKDPSIAEGVTYFDFVVTGGKAFLDRYRERFHREAGFGSAKAYDAVYLLKNGMESCGLSSAEIRECLTKVNFKGISGSISFDRDGVIKTSGKNTYLLEVKNGRFEPLIEK